METDSDAEREVLVAIKPCRTPFVVRKEILDTVNRHLLKGQHVSAVPGSLGKSPSLPGNGERRVVYLHLADKSPA
jgi:hypothetical protein